MNFSQIKIILASTYWEQRNAGRMGIVWIIFALAGVGAVLPILFMEAGAAAWRLSLTLFVVISCCDLLLWWTAFSANMAKLASPTVKPMLPGAGSILPLTYVATWLAATTLVALLFLLTPLPFAVMFLATGFVFCFLTLVLNAGNWLWGLPFYCAGIWMPAVVHHGSQIVATYGVNNILLALLLALAGMLGITVYVIFLRRGDGAFRSQAKLVQRREALSGNWSPGQMPQWQAQLNGRWMYDWALAKIDHKAVAARAGNAKRWLAYGFGAGLHWSTAVGTAVWMLIFVTAFSLMPLQLGLTTKMVFSDMNGAMNARFMSAFLVFLSSQHILTTLHQTRKEQHLITLLPAVPARTGINQALILLIFRHYFLTAACSLAATLLLLAVVSQLSSHTAVQAVSGTMMSSAILFFLLPDFSRMTKPMFRSLLTMLIGMPVVLLPGFFDGNSVLTLGAGLLVAGVSFSFVWYRWHWAPGLPPALPVGRLA